MTLSPCSPAHPLVDCFHADLTLNHHIRVGLMKVILGATRIPWYSLSHLDPALWFLRAQLGQHGSKYAKGLTGLLSLFGLHLITPSGVILHFHLPGTWAWSLRWLTLPIL